jgi:hypothetical protein
MQVLMRIKALRRTAGFAVMLFCAQVAGAAAGGNDPPIPCEAIDSVGTARMSADGIITLRLHTLWPQRFVESEHVYAPDDPLYGVIRRHLGGIAPGEAKPVPPLCGTNSEP